MCYVQRNLYRTSDQSISMGWISPSFFSVLYRKKKKSHLQSSHEMLGVSSRTLLRDLHLSSSMLLAPSPLICLAEDFPGLARTPRSSPHTTARYKMCWVSQEIFSSAVETQETLIDVGQRSQMSPMRSGPSTQGKDRSLPTPVPLLEIISPYEIGVVAVHSQRQQDCTFLLHSSRGLDEFLSVGSRWEPSSWH